MLDSGRGLDNLRDLRPDGSLAFSVEYRRSPIMDVNLKKENIKYHLLKKFIIYTLIKLEKKIFRQN